MEISLDGDFTVTGGIRSQVRQPLLAAQRSTFNDQHQNIERFLQCPSYVLTRKCRARKACARLTWLSLAALQLVLTRSRLCLQLKQRPFLGY